MNALAHDLSSLHSRVFDDVNRELIAHVEKEISIPRWPGLRGMAGDGTTVQLTIRKKRIRSIVRGVAFGLDLSGIELFRTVSPLQVADGQW